MKITQPKIACISDLHFGVHLNSEIWHKINLEFFDWFKKQLINFGIKDIVIAGDVFHNRNEISVNTIHNSNLIFNKLKDFNIIIIPGNHDVFYKDRSDIHSLGLLNGWENIEVINEPYKTTFFNKKIGFCPWACDHTSLKDCDIMFGHFEINNFKIAPFKTCEHGLSYNDLLSKDNLVISGHFHYTDFKKYDNGMILYLGCPYEMYWSDYGNTKGFYILDIETKNVEFIENTISPKHVKIKFSELINSKKIPDNWPKLIKNNIVNFVIDVKLNLDKIDVVVKKIQSYSPINFKITHTDESLKPDEVSILNIENIDIPNNIKEFVELLDITNKEEIIDYIIDLYNTLNK